jgi:purine-nucleoside phosphorylase
VVVLQGRVHAYEGFDDATITRGIELMAALGVRTILLTNASGGLRRDMRGGDLLVMADHLDFVRPRSSPVGPAAGPRDAVPRGTPLYDPGLVDLALAAARRAGVRARPGVYARLLGPTYETRAEYRMLLRLGADVAGMSTVPEARAARRLGIAVVAISVVTNVATPDAPEETDAEDVCRLAARGTDGVWAVLEALAARGPGGKSGRKPWEQTVEAR